MVVVAVVGLWLWSVVGLVFVFILVFGLGFGFSVFCLCQVCVRFDLFVLLDCRFFGDDVRFCIESEITPSSSSSSVACVPCLLRF